MGTRLGRHKDFNRVLARQPRTSIDINTFEASSTHNQPPPIDTLSIPDPIVISHTDYQSVPTPPVVAQEFYSPYPPAEPNQAPVQSFVSPPPVYNNPPSLVHSLPRQNFAPIEPPRASLERSFSVSPQTNIPMSRRVTRNDAIVISRSVMNLRDQRRLRNRQPLPSARPHRSIVERNGKQFLTEYRERAEKRYVQCFDETTGQLRLFEVVDYIPSRVVQPMRYPSQSRLSHYTSQHSLMNPLQSNPNLVRPAASVDQLQSGMLSPLGDTTNSNGNETVASNNAHLQHGPAPMVSDFYAKQKKDAPMNSSQLYPSQNLRSATPSLVNSHYYSSQNLSPASLNFVPPAAQIASNQYASEPFLQQPSYIRARSPTASDHSVHSSDESDEGTETDDAEYMRQLLREGGGSRGYGRANPNVANNRLKVGVSYGTADGYHSSASIDPFARPTHTSDHLYRKRPSNHYAEPVVNQRTWEERTQAAYVPIPHAVRRPNANSYSLLDLNANAYNR